MPAFVGLDFAPAIAGNDVDVRAAPHDQDLAGVADTYGPRDLGAIAEVGQQFQREMGGIAGAYVAFAGKWNVGRAISADPEGFRDEANGIFKALHQRIQRENQELYPLAEKI